MHTSGQPFVMSFQAGGPHAQDRALEAIVGALVEQERVPASVVWEKPAKGEPVRMQKDYRIVPRGVALVIGCNTFPTWNSYPGLFASLATGNAVVVKPHPRAVLPLAISVEAARTVLEATGFDPALVQLAPEADGEGLARTLAERPEVAIIDYTGGPGFGGWLEREAAADGKQVYTEKSGVNSIVLDSTDNLRGVLGNLAFSLSLYSGQMCTTPQNIYVPRDGIDDRRGPPVLRARSARGWPRRSPGSAPTTPRRSRSSARRSTTTCASRAASLPELAAKAGGTRGPRQPPGDPPDLPRRGRAHARPGRGRRGAGLGLHAGVLRPGDLPHRHGRHAQSLQVMRDTIREHGAMTAAVYSTSEDVLDAARDAAADCGVALSENLTGPVFVNQTAAFSDYHGTGANPAANSAYVDAAFVANRFRVVTSRRHV